MPLEKNLLFIAAQIKILLMNDKCQKSNLIDYIAWRGDLTFQQSPLNDVDAIIFCQLSYLNFSGLLPNDFSQGLSLSTLGEKFLNAADFAQRSNMGMLIDPQSVQLLKECASSKRFSSVKCWAFISQYDLKKEEQFSAITFEISKDQIFLAFRGTDDTLIGWKEDFNLAFLEEVPAQIDALAYLEKAAAHFKKSSIITGGHSKGGNLALFASANLSEKAKKRLESVWNFDGPGFSEENLKSPGFQSIYTKIHSVYPQFSIVGMLFHHFPGFKVVLSDEKLVMQHNPFSWYIRGRDFITTPLLDQGSEVFFKSFNTWFDSLKPKQREDFVETLFGLISSTNAATNTELSKDWLKNTGKILKAFMDLDKEIRDEAVKIAGDFLKVVSVEIMKK